MPRTKRPAATRRTTRRKAPAEPRLSRLRRPEQLSVEAWQAQLRRQFGREQPFLIDNLGAEPVFSEFAVTNPQSGGRYRVAIRGAAAGENYCSCPDFATNDLGTCKHVEFTLARLEARRGGKAALKRGFTPPYSEIYLNYAGARSVRFRAGAECPAALARRAAVLFDQASGWTLPQSRFAQFDAYLAIAQKSGHELRCYDDALAFIAAARDAENRGRALDAAYARGPRTKGLAKLLKTKLYPYQIEGALFAVRAGRCLIGDEMGLGKTIQAIAAAELFARHFGSERVLVVCPTSLKHQWQREFARFTGSDAQVIQGPRDARAHQYREAAPWKIANYDTLARDLDLIGAWSPDLVIVDEAQRIKNWNTIAARALKRIASPYAVVLTGTPLENRLEELVSIVQFVDQHRLGPTWRLLHEHQMRDETGRVVGYRNLDRLGATLAPVMLRRRKAEVLDQLPERVDNTFFVPMTPQQLQHHDENADTVARIVKRWRRTGHLSEIDQRVLTCALQNMRMSCNSTYLLDHETDHGTKADELATLLGELFERPEAKAVIFSQWVRTHELIIRRLDAARVGYVLFHGGVPAQKRGELVERFHRDPACRVFLSTDAGGVGLNLQHAASTVINMDLPWNPAVLEQRIGRVHRMGQTKSVQVVNFVAQGTIEEGMLSVLAFKKSLFAGVLDGGANEVFLHGTRLARFMESVDRVTGKMGEPEPQVEEPKPAAATAPIAETALQEQPAPPEPAAPAEVAAAAGAREPSRAPDPWATLVDAGLKLVESLAAPRSDDGREARAVPESWLETDPKTGRTYLKLPAPAPETLQRLAGALETLLAGMRQR
ncbi:MAG: helicase SNF2 [Betaproteobacteria bacterium RBG_16_64_18]|nr:MAG: helicase SNF2 [Betaproteobacteria bacterium RBG_16_64_18]